MPPGSKPFETVEVQDRSPRCPARYCVGDIPTNFRKTVLNWEMDPNPTANVTSLTRIDASAKSNFAFSTLVLDTYSVSVNPVVSLKILQKWDELRFAAPATYFKLSGSVMWA